MFSLRYGCIYPCAECLIDEPGEWLWVLGVFGFLRRSVFPVDEEGAELALEVSEGELGVK